MLIYFSNRICIETQGYMQQKMHVLLDVGLL